MSRVVKNRVIRNVKLLVYAKYRSFIENKRSPVLRFFHRCVYCHTSCLRFLQSYFIYSTYDLYLNFLFFFVRQRVSDHLDEQTRSAD